VLVEQGTLESQRVITGTLGDLPERVAELAIQSPALLIVGEVVRLHGTVAPEAAVAHPEGARDG
ncbi:MAG: uroporphyrinogen-III C-methyltransferase, partial [Thiohalorhabdaceae bacterium]